MMIKKSFNGIAISALLAGLALWLSSLLPNFPISPLIWGVLIGLVVGNLLGQSLNIHAQQGLSICTKYILRLGVVLYGFRITVDGLLAVGWMGLGLSLFTTLSTLWLGCYVGQKVFKLDKQTSFLTAIGSAVCGAAAVLAAESVSRAKPHQAAIAVATVVLFGTLAMLLYPVLYHAGVLLLSPWQYGFYTGASIHEVAQVLAAGEAAGSAPAEIAVIVKMTRVLLLAPILIIAGIYFNRQASDAQVRLPIYIPWFVFGFVVCIGIHSLKLISYEHTAMIQAFDLFLLTMAMTALGLSTSFKALASVGLQPFYLGGALFIWLMLATWTVVVLFI
jgi:uncharacterized integral membrane protein (TIGR00698 family)